MKRAGAALAGLCLVLAPAGAGCAQEVGPAPEAPTLRETLDQGRSRLAEHLFGMQVSAFGDALGGYAPDGARTFGYDAGEVDVAGDLTRDVQLGLAVVNTPALTKLTVGFLDYHPFGGQIAPRGQLWVEKGFHVQAGRFDVPFGNDWQFYASKDSVSISRPLTTAAIMGGGYNDAGVRVLGNNGTLNFNTYLLQGFEPGRLLGARLGLTPFGDPFSLKGTREPKVAELGLSWFYDGTSRWEKRETGLALDADGRLGPYYVRAEYVTRTREPEPGAPSAGTSRGWHLTQELALGNLAPWPMTLFVRGERVTAATAGFPDGRDTRAAAGGSASLAGIVQFKLEWDHYLAASPATLAVRNYRPSQWYAQLVVVL